MTDTGSLHQSGLKCEAINNQGSLIVPLAQQHHSLPIHIVHTSINMLCAMSLNLAKSLTVSNILTVIK